MRHIWTRGDATAEDCREALLPARPLKDSTIRTVLRRLEEKGYLTHNVEGRTYLYRPAVAPQRAAAQAVKGIMDRFCGGSLEQLLAGMVDNEVLDGDELQRIAVKIARSRKEKR